MLKDSITRRELADFLNHLVEVDEYAVKALLKKRVPANDALAAHPTVQVLDGPEASPYQNVVGFLGVVNGAFGVVEDGPFKGNGGITVLYDDRGGVHFKITEEAGFVPTMEGRP